LRKLADAYDITRRYDALNYMNERHEHGEVVTGLLYLDPLAADLHAALNTVDQPLNTLSHPELNPGSRMLNKINSSLR
jgi:2-oxoglutarate ferredoxin oxidoreductase subunit beta